MLLAFTAYAVWAWPAPPGNQAEEEAVQRADQAFVQALAKADKPVLSRLLAPDFTWTDAGGRTRNRHQFLEEPLPGAPADSRAKLHDYTTVMFLTGAAEASGSHVRFVRVWAKDGGGWRLLLEQQTKIEEGKKRAPATVAAGTACQNPCRSVPYQPKTVAQRQVLESWEGLETAVNERNADEWARHVADEFVFNVKENGKPLTKADRVATIRKQAQSPRVTDIGAVVPNSMDVSVFGETSLMRDTQQPTVNEPPYRAMRIWVKRDGRWQLVYSQQTTTEK